MARLLTVGEQHNLEQHGRRVGGGTGGVVAVACIETGQVDLMLDQMVQSVLERARQELALQIDSEKPRTGVNVLVAGHSLLPKPNAGWSLDIPFGSRQDAPMMRVFLQLR